LPTHLANPTVQHSAKIAHRFRFSLCKSTSIVSLGIPINGLWDEDRGAMSFLMLNDEGMDEPITWKACRAANAF
jgi:hypothetical protein